MIDDVSYYRRIVGLSFTGRGVRHNCNTFATLYLHCMILFVWGKTESEIVLQYKLFQVCFFIFYFFFRDPSLDRLP